MYLLKPFIVFNLALNDVPCLQLGGEERIEKNYHNAVDRFSHDLLLMWLWKQWKTNGFRDLIEHSRWFKQFREFAG